MANKTITMETLGPDFREKVISMMKDEGMSIKEVCAEFNITPGIHSRLKRDFDEYRLAFEDGVSFAEAWWMKQGRENLQNKGFNVGIYAFQMKNRYKWRDTPLIVQGKERNLADNFEEKEVIGKYKIKKEDSQDENIIN